MWAVSAALALAALQPTGQAALPNREDPPPELVAFRTDPIHRITVPIRINGRTHRFLVDTGAERTGISIELARSLGLPTGAPLLVTGFAGNAWVPSVALPAVEFAKSSKSNLRALAFSREAIGADGFLGLDALGGQMVMFDFAAREAQVVQSGPGFANFFDAKPGDIVDVTSKRGRLVFTDASANGLSIQAMLDTGSSVSVGNEALRRELIKRGKLGPGVRIHMLAVTGEVIPADYVVVRHLVIGGIRISNLQVAFAEFAPFKQLGFTDQPALLLGMDALRQFDQVRIDFSKREVRFTVRSPGKFILGKY